MIKKNISVKMKSRRKRKIDKKSDELIITEQFHRIQRKYNNLISDVVKEIDLIKKWIGRETVIRRNAIKLRFTQNS